MRTGTIHFARLDKSPRLQRIFVFLKRAGSRGATGIEIALECDVLNPATYCSELRHNGIPIDCSYEGETVGGRKVYRYIMKGLNA